MKKKTIRTYKVVRSAGLKKEDKKETMPSEQVQEYVSYYELFKSLSK